MTPEYIEYTIETGPSKGETRPALVVSTNDDGSKDLHVSTLRRDKLTPTLTLSVEGFLPKTSGGHAQSPPKDNSANKPDKPKASKPRAK